MELTETDNEMFKALRESILGRQLTHYVRRLGDFLADSRQVDPALPEDQQSARILANRRAADVMSQHLLRHIALAKGKGKNVTRNEYR